MALGGGKIEDLEPVGDDVPQLAATRADQVMVRARHVGVITLRPITRGYHEELAHFDQVGEGVVHGGPADLGQLLSGLKQDLVGGQVYVLAGEDVHDGAPLGAHAPAPPADSKRQVGEFGMRRCAGHVTDSTDIGPH